MNTLFLIGNGFDLAHGHKTKYSEFIYWYLDSVSREFQAKGSIENDLLEIVSNNNSIPFLDTTIEDLIEYLNKNNVQWLQRFFENTVKKSGTSNWVDIEEEYYLDLKTALVYYNSNGGEMRFVRSLNSAFLLLKSKFIEYLNSIKKDFIKNERIAEIISNEIFISSRFPSKFNSNLFLNFNYTELISNYVTFGHGSNNLLLNIHGSLDFDQNPIIFGYGDETDPDYQSIENLNKNEFLDFIKSSHYPLTENYRNLMSFVDSEKYNVIILGHSCGISDRVLLNAILDNKNCNEIKIYYYNRNGGDDFIEKVQNISRHFHKEHKTEMRKKIVSKNPAQLIG